MFKPKFLLVGGLPLLFAIVIVTSWLSAAPLRTAQDRLDALQEPAVYWIGVQVAPVPKLLLSHFGVNEESGSRIAVEYVMPDSPAAEAGLKRGDILVKFGDEEIYSLPDLIEQVSKIKETATKLEIIRAGTKTVLTVTPALRPDVPRQQPNVFDLRENTMERMEQMRLPQIPQFGRPLPMDAFKGREPLLMMRQMEDFFRQMQDGNDGNDFLMVPNMQQRIADTGKQLSVVMQTDQNGKSSVKVTQVLKNDEDTKQSTWEAETIDELPEEIRADVKMLLGHP